MSEGMCLERFSSYNIIHKEIEICKHIYTIFA
jgi:hypothetical protein